MSPLYFSWDQWRETSEAHRERHLGVAVEHNVHEGEEDHAQVQAAVRNAVRAERRPEEDGGCHEGHQATLQIQNRWAIMYIYS
jgi:hypothetical protein